MIRVVLTVLLAVALLAVSLPALDDARTETTADRIGAEAERIEHAAAALTVDSVAVNEVTLAARDSLVVRAPGGFGAAPIDDLTLVNVDSERIDEARIDRDGGSVGAEAASGALDADVALTYRLRGGPLRAIPIPNPADTIELAVVDGPIALQTTGESRIELRFVTTERGAAIRLSRVG